MQGTAHLLSEPHPSARPAGIVLLALLSLATSTMMAQAIPRTQYLRFLPLEVPRIVAQQPASVELSLFGDRDAPGYRDVAPRNGIDDARDRQLEALAVRFAPYMVRNTSLRPMDHARFGDGATSWPLIIDEWQVAQGHPELVRSDSVNLTALAGASCSDDPRSEDCRLRDLIRRFRPAGPTEPEIANRPLDPRDQRLSVMYLDFPGKDAVSWHRIFTDPKTGDLPPKFAGFERVYVHPFVAGPRAAEPESGYELVLQYWLFYPTNDGGNDHEGDWEHINVVVSPLSLVAGPLSPDAVRAMLARVPDDLDGPDPLVLRRVEYYFHHNVAVVEFGAPDAYQPRGIWRAAVRALGRGRVGAPQLLEETRRRVWADRAETRINTHPIVYIGADSKGLELLLYPPGSRNRDSHGSYPFPGLFEGVGPAGSGEEIRRVFDHQRYLGDPTRPLPGWVVAYDRTDRVTVVPDWERVLDLVEAEPEARRTWAWLLLPIRWGYPAAESPLAGIVEHAETGNLAPVGPAFNGGWNGTGATPGYAVYAPHRLSRAVRGGFEDTFRNDFGVLNAPIALLSNLPPIDVVFKLLFAPVRAITQRDHPAWTSSDAPPRRKLSLGVGLARIETPGASFATLFNIRQFKEITYRLPDSTAHTDPATGFGERVVVPTLSLEFNLGARVSIENTLRYSSARIGVLARSLDTSVPAVSITGQLRQWEYGGALRYRLTTGRLRPYLKVGYGLTWWRTTGVVVNGDDTVRDGDWIRAPHPLRLSHLLPNAWQFGAGAEWLVLQSRVPFPQGVNVGLRLEYAATTYSLRLAEQIPPGEDVRTVQDQVWRRAAMAMLRVEF